VRRLALLGATAVAVFAAASSAASARGPLQVRTSITPDWIYFADPVTARIDVVVDRTVIDAESVVVTTSFSPWEQASGSRTTSAQTAAVAHLTLVYNLRCVVFACIPHGTVVQRFHLPVVTVTARSVDGASIVVKKPWPPVNVAGRFLPPVTGAVRPQLVLQTQAPPARFGLPPSAAALGLDVGAAIVGAAAVALILLELRRYVERRRHPVDERPPLVRALHLAREAQTRDAEDRRRAVALVAQLLPRPAAEQTTAAEIAWSKPDPSPDDVGDLVETIEAKLERR
jgi:hypothetical protein